MADQLSPEEAERRAQQVARRLLTTPPQPRTSQKREEEARVRTKRDMDGREKLRAKSLE